MLLQVPPNAPQEAAFREVCRPCNALETLFAVHNVRFTAGAKFPAVPLDEAGQALRRALADCPAGWGQVAKSENNQLVMYRYYTSNEDLDCFCYN